MKGMVLLALLLGLSFAGCASEAYSQACSSCGFDENGTMNLTCRQGYESSGVACVRSAHPVASLAYVAGVCPAANTCAEELRNCSSGYENRTDKGNCNDASVAACVAAADECVDNAAKGCGEIWQPDIICQAARPVLGVMSFCTFTGIIPFLLGAALYFYKRDDRRFAAVGVALVAAGTVMLALAGTGTVLYVLTPRIIGRFYGMDYVPGC